VFEDVNCKDKIVAVFGGGFPGDIVLVKSGLGQTFLGGDKWTPDELRTRESFGRVELVEVEKDDGVAAADVKN